MNQHVTRRSRTVPTVSSVGGIGGIGVGLFSLCALLAPGEAPAEAEHGVSTTAEA